MAEKPKKKSSGGILGGLVGAFLGFLIGGPLGALQGFTQGYLVGSAFGDTELPPGPRLEDAAFNESRYGVAIPRVYGTDLVTSNIIWMKDNKLREVEEEVTVAESLFGDTTQIQYKYYATFAVALCEGSIDGVERIWANDEVIFSQDSRFGTQGQLFSADADGQIKLKSIRDVVNDFSGDLEAAIPSAKELKALTDSGLKIRIYKGDLSQLPDPTMVESLGESTSAFRGVSYIVFDNLLLTNPRYRNQIPELRFQVKRTKLDLAERNGDIRTFGQTFSPTLRNGELAPYGINRVVCEYRPSGSLAYNSSGSSFFGSNGKYAFINYAYDAGLIFGYRMFHDGPTYNHNLLILYQNGSTSLIQNMETRLHLFRVYDPSDLYIGKFYSSGIATDPADNARLVHENPVKIYPFDFGLTTNVSIPNIIPIQNLPNWFISTRGTSLYVGTTKGERVVIFDTRLNLNSAYIDGESNLSYGGGDENFNVVAFLAGGLVYVYCNRVREGSYFPGVICIDLSGLQATAPVPYITTPNNFTISLGGNSYFNTSTKPTLVVQDPAIRLRDFSTSRIVWNRDWMFTQLAFDYKTNALFGLACTNAAMTNNWYIQEQSGKVSDLYTNNPVILDQDVNYLYRLNPTTLARSTDTQGEGFVTDARLTREVWRPRIVLARVYPGVLDLGHSVLTITEDINESVLIPTNSNNELKQSTTEYQFEGAGEEVVYPNAPSRFDYDLHVATYILPDLVYDGNEKVNIIAGGYNTVYINSFSRPPLFALGVYLGKQVTTLDGSIADLFLSTPGVQVGEMLLAEIERTGYFDADEFTDFSELTQTVIGYSIKDRGALVSTLKTFQDAYLFDVLESDYKITSKVRELATIRRTLPYNELGASEGQAGSEISLTVPSRDTTPSFYYLTFRNKDLAYDTDTVVWQDPSANTDGARDIKSPLVLSHDQARNLIRKVALSTISSRVGEATIETSFKHSDLELSDFITVELKGGQQYTLRIIEIDKGRPGIVKIKGSVDHPSNYTFNEADVESQSNIVKSLGSIASILVIDSLPFDQSEDGGDGTAYWVGSYNPAGTDVLSSALSVIDNSGSSITNGSSLTSITPVGFCFSTPLPAVKTEGVFDYTSELIFNPLTDAIGFTTKTRDEVLSDYYTNTYLYGSGNTYEMIKILNFTPNTDGSMTASGILRGYKGTSHLSSHDQGDYLIGMNFGSLSRILIDSSYIQKSAQFVISSGNKFFNPSSYLTVDYGTRRPMPPINLEGYKTDSGEFNLSWTRQGRFNVDWVNSFDMTLDEESEKYIVYIIDSSTFEILREKEVLDATNTTITSQDLNNAYGFGNVPNNITVAVAQFSDTIDEAGFPSGILTI